MLLRRHRRTEEANLDSEVKEEALEETEEEDTVDYSKLKVDELKNLLDEKEIEYDSKAKKEDLIKLLEGAE